MSVKARICSQQSQDDNTPDSNKLFTILQMHPYQYLTTVNSIFNQCNKSSEKSYSEVSKIKLPWKQFNLITIPKYFEELYAETIKYSEKKHSMEEDRIGENQKKFWKEHEELVEKFMQKRVEDKKKRQQEKSKYYKKRPNTAKQNFKSQIYTGPRDVFLKKIIQKNENIVYNKEELKLQVLQKLKKLNEQSNTKTFNNIKPSLSKNSSMQRIKSAKPSILKASSIKVNYNNINTNEPENNSRGFQHKNRTFQSKISQKQHKSIKWLPTPSQLNFKKTTNSQLQLLEVQNKSSKNISTPREQNNITQQDYLEFETTEQILNRYKDHIKQVDCSISNNNVKKTISLLKDLEKIAQQLT